MIPVSRPLGLWICLLSIWWIGSLIAWTNAAISTWHFPIAQAAIFGTGLFILAVTTALRLPALTSTWAIPKRDKLLAWLLGIGANINWLGMLALRSDALFPITMVSAIAILVEMWLFQAMQTESRTSRLATIQKAVDEDNSVDGQTSAQAQGELPARSIALQSGSENVIAENDPGGDRALIVRSSEDGIDEDGNRYLSGQIHTRWQLGQKAQTIIIGFTPAFRSKPFVDIEVDSPEFSVRCVNCTQTGIRLNIKRGVRSDSSGNGSLLENQVVATLVWYAAEKQHDSESTHVNDVPSTLP